MVNDSSTVRFSSESNAEFYSILRKRVNEYFKTSNISKFGNYKMVIKSIVMCSMYFGSYALFLANVSDSLIVNFLFWIVMGFGAAGIGMSVMHDANHGAYSKSLRVNKFMSMFMNLIGSNSTIWIYQHNVLHHSFTNVEGHDEDINVPFFLRFSPHQKLRKLHRFQHIYAWFFYGLQTIARVTVGDFTQAFVYRKKGLITSKKAFRKVLLNVLFWKLFYYSYMIVLPIIILPFSPWFTIFCYLTMHFIQGLFLSAVFQSAHIMPECAYPLHDEEGNMANNWAVHQLETTTNFSPKSRIFSWYIGGLNYQVEHHLFSGICHIHYKKLSSIVRETAKEFNIRYNTQKSFVHALYKHTQMLKQLGTTA